MKEKNPSFNLIYRSTCSDIRLQSNEGKTSMTHAPVLSNLKGLTIENDLFYCCLIKTHENN